MFPLRFVIKQKITSGPVLDSRAPTPPAAAAAARRRRSRVSIADRSLGGVGPVRDLRGGGRTEEQEGGVRSGPGAARTILLFHIMSAVPRNSLLWWEVPLGCIAFG
jgi:hypothetical protein